MENCLIEVYQERDMIVGNTWFKKRRKNKYTWERLNPRDRALMDHVLIERELRVCLREVNVIRV